MFSAVHFSAIYFCQFGLGASVRVVQKVRREKKVGKERRKWLTAKSITYQKLAVDNDGDENILYEVNTGIKRQFHWNTHW